MIVAPWWQWTDPETQMPGQPVDPRPLDGRLSRPIFQKYDSPDLVNQFLKDPQHCQKFVDDDLVHSVQPSSRPSLSKLGKLFRIGARKLPDNTVVDQQYVPDGTNTRKIFLDTHKRFYLVVSGIHCDGPGFPKVAREKVCKAGFVIRRRTVTPPSSGVKEVEPILPLYPLIPDKNEPAHAGQYDTVYFGVLPTSSHDHEGSGRARFDDREFYEVRCWALRHLRPHDPDQPCPCPDGIFWSVPTRPYKLASHYDLTGTSNQPVTIQLPDLNDLAAQAKPHLGVGFAKPPGSLMISGDKDGKPQSPGRSGGFEICFIPIPLITIVATFVFELFLPVIMFIFQLWWMLALKFCIPPEIDVAGGISGEIGLDGKIGINADLNVDASIEASIQGSVDLTINGPDLVGGTDVSIRGRYGDDVANALTATYSPIALANMELAVSDASKPATSPSVNANIEFEPEVVHT